MTIVGIILCVIFCIVAMGAALYFAFCVFDNSPIGISASIFIGMAVCIAIIFGMRWYYTETASGQRAVKTQESDFSNGIERAVRVYDVNGQLIEEYDGKFDLEYDDDRILFDDEDGKRHIIFYTTGTVIIDEK